MRLATDRRHYQEGGGEAMHAAGFVQKERRGILLSTFSLRDHGLLAISALLPLFCFLLLFPFISMRSPSFS